MVDNNLDQLELDNGNEKFIAYILGNTQYNGENYIYYVRELNDHYSMDDVYVGKLVNGSYISFVSPNVIPYLEERLVNLVKEL